MIAAMWLACALSALGDEDGGAREEHEEHEEHEENEEGEHEGKSASTGPSGVAPVTDVTWQSECSSCHMAYPPGLLPARSWDLLLSTLPQHFGDDASVDAATLDLLTKFARANAADASPYRLSAAIARASAGSTPQRILDIGWLREEHGEISPSRWRDNTAVRSLSNCVACHPGASSGRFNESEIAIPRAPIVK